MTTSTRDSHEVNIELDQHNPCEKSNGGSTGASYSTGKRENNDEERGRLLIVEAKQELNLFEKQMITKSIFQFPRWAKSITPRYFEIGPFHGGEQNLKATGDKNEAVLFFLSLINKPLEYVMQEMKEVVGELQANYEILEDKWRNDTIFVELMIFDACFILYFLLGYRRRSIAYDPHYGTYKASHRPIPQFRDMVLVDNQLPLLAVKVLFQILARSKNQQPWTDGEINNFVFHSLGMDDMVNKTQTLGLHILDLYRKGIIGRLRTYNVSASSLTEWDSDVPSSFGQPPPDSLQPSPFPFPSKQPLIDNGVPSTLPFPLERPSIRNGVPSPFGPPPPNSPQPSPSRRGKILSAVKLHMSGVTFKKSRTNKITDIRFDEDKGILMLPQFFIDEATESTFLSLMIFEKFYVGRQGILQVRLRKAIKNLQWLFREQVQMKLPEQLRTEIDEQIKRELLPKLMTTADVKEVIPGKIPKERLKLLLPQLQSQIMQLEGFYSHVTSYVFFMKELIESDSDVRLLKSKEIITLDVENELAAAQLLNRLTKDILHLPTDNIEELRRKVNKYSQRKVNRSVKTEVNRWLATLRNLYFENPWFTIGVIGGMMILVLTYLQTYYSFLSYKHPRGNS